MTLLTYADKYVIQSGDSVASSVAGYVDDTPATQTFTLYSTKTVLVIYAANTAHGITSSAYGYTNAINVDSTNHSLMGQSAYGTSYSMKNTCVWVGSLDAGEHTIKGTFFRNSTSGIVTISNRTLIIYILDGDEFNYVENTTSATLSSTSYADDANASVTATPSAACKALIFYGLSNAFGSTERYVGKKIMINTDSTDRTDTEMFQAGYNSGGTNCDSVTTVWAESITATSRTFKGRWAGNGVQLVTANRRFLCVLFLADDTILDTDTDATAVSSTTTALADDGYISITREHEGELLCLYAATKAPGTSSAVYGTQYGISLDSTDVANARSTSSYSTDGHQALVAYAATVESGSHTLKGRFSTNYATSTVYATKKIMVALWFPVKTPLVYSGKYVKVSDNEVYSSSSTFSDDSNATRTISLSVAKTVLVFYETHATYGDTNNVDGFKTAISIDSTDYAIMCTTGYAANYPMRNCSVWVGTLAAGSHTITGRYASNTNATNTTISSRTFIVYVLNGDANYYIDDTTGQALPASETYNDDATALISVTPKANCKALIIYGVTNNPGTTEHYVGKKICVSVNGTDYTDCEARQSSYSSGGDNPDSVTTAYGISLDANTNYVIKGRVASVYTYATYVSRRFLAILLFDDSALLDIDASTTSENTTSATLVDDPDISISRNTMGELLVFYAATKTSFTNSDIQGNRYGIMIDGHDVAESRTSQAFSGSANSCLVGMASTVYSQNHTLKGRYSANEDTGTVYLTGRCMTALWLPRTVVSATFENTHDVRLSKTFTGRNDIAIKKVWSSYNDIIAQTLVNKYFQATNDIKVSRVFVSANDERLSKAFTNRTDIGVKRLFSGSNDLRLSKTFASADDIKIIKAFAASLDLKLTKTFTNRDDIKVYKAFVETNDIKVSKQYATSNYIRLFKTFSVISDVKVLKTWGSSNDERLSKAQGSSSDIKLYRAFNSSSDIKALYTWAFHNSNDIKLIKAFSSTSDLKLIKAFQSLSDALYSKIISSHDDILLKVGKNSYNDLRLIKSFSATNDLTLHQAFEASVDLKLSKTFTNRDDIRVYKAFVETNDIKVSKQYASSNDERLYKTFSVISDIKVLRTWGSSNDERLSKAQSSSNDIKLSKAFSSLSDIKALYSWAFHNSNDVQLIRAFSSTSDLKLIKAFQSLSDALYSKIISSRDDILLKTQKSSSSDLRLIKAFSASNDLTLHQAFEASVDIFLSLHKSSASDIYISSSNSSTSNINMSKAFESANNILEALFVQSTSDILLYKHFSSHNEILGLVWTQFASSNNIQISKAFESYSDIAYSDVFSSINDIDALAQFATDNDILRTNVKFSRNDIRVTKRWTSRNDMVVYKVYASKNTLWLYSVKSSRNDINIIKHFVNSNDLDVYRKLTSTNDVFVKKNFSVNSKIRVDRFVESSNNILFEKEFKSTNDVFEFIHRLFASTNSILLVEEFINSNNINVNKSFSSTNIIVKVIWDLTYPLTVVVSQNERTVTISAISRKVFLDQLPARTATIDLQKRTVTVDQSDRSVTINKW